MCGHSSCTCQNMAACDFAVLWFCCLLKILFTFRQAFCNSSLRVQFCNYSKIGAAQLEKQQNDMIYHNYCLILGLYLQPLCIIFGQKIADMHFFLTVVSDVNCCKIWTVFRLYVLQYLLVGDLWWKWRALLKVKYHSSSMMKEKVRIFHFTSLLTKSQ